jgi:uncharacterized protein YqjF (DUF2071 family)
MTTRSTIAREAMRRERWEPLLLADWSNAERPPTTHLIRASGGTLEEFLFERYSAFTMWHGLRRRFRVWHPPWKFASFEATVSHDSLLEETGSWHREARFVGAHFAPGFSDVWMGRPRLIPRTLNSEYPCYPRNPRFLSPS